MVRILVTDDDDNMSAYLQEEFSLQGWETVIVSNGVEAVLRVVDEVWDAVVMDVRMPNLNGIDALRIIQRIKPEIPVLILTGQANRRVIYEADRYGAFRCLVKPIEPETLVEALKEAIADYALPNVPLPSN